ncbi:unnamed protein product [Protopolystoma xenopodis]|uniref:Uncharacterized protein n=1 Tax=Protopolystoma xenopodis TaxID=117903 RepID=A0A3S5BDE3_9PLAT|nr:unnamed protein product [Protopolystoma xenopodis]
MVLRIARLTDNADYGAGEMSGNVPRPRRAIFLLKKNIHTHAYILSHGISYVPLFALALTRVNWIRL